MRRLYLRALVSLAVLLVAIGCWARSSLEYVEVVTGGADPESPLPMIIAVHGLGDRPESFSRLFQNYPWRARIICPRAPTPYGDGFAWFPFRVRQSDEKQLAVGISGAAEKVAELARTLVKTRPTQGRPVITGFSQGGMTSFAVAAKYPDQFRSALPVGGLLPEALIPAKSSGMKPNIKAFHGETDPAVPLTSARRAIQGFQAAGYSATLLEYPATGHVISAEIWKDWAQALRVATSTASP